MIDMLFVPSIQKIVKILNKFLRVYAFRGVPRPLEGVAEDSPWTLSLCSRVTEGRGCSQGEASPFYSL